MWLRKFIVVTIAIVAIFFIVTIYFFSCGLGNGITSEIRKIDCSGIIVSIDTTSACFVDINVQQKNNIVKLNASYCCSPDFIKFVSIGDSIKKKSGELFLFVTKPNSDTTKRFDFPICVQ